MKLRVSPAARIELRGIAHQVTSDNGIAVADRIVTKIIGSMSRLERFPELGKSGRVAGTRELGVGGLPFLIVYRIEPKVITVLRVIHGAMQWPPAA